MDSVKKNEIEQEKIYTIAKSVSTKRKRQCNSSSSKPASSSKANSNNNQNENKEINTNLDINPNGTYVVPVDFLGFFQSGYQQNYTDWKNNSN
jgi:hypothetical protein